MLRHLYELRTRRALRAGLELRESLLPRQSPCGIQGDLPGGAFRVQSRAFPCPSEYFWVYARHLPIPIRNFPCKPSDSRLPLVFSTTTAISTTEDAKFHWRLLYSVSEWLIYRNICRVDGPRCPRGRQWLDRRAKSGHGVATVHQTRGREDDPDLLGERRGEVDRGGVTRDCLLAN